MRLSLLNVSSLVQVDDSCTAAGAAVFAIMLYLDGRRPDGCVFGCLCFMYSLLVWMDDGWTAAGAAVSG